jgi:NIPSNAP
LGPINPEDLLMLYDLTLLDVHGTVAAEVAKGVSAWTKDAPKGQLLGMFQSDVGQLNQMYVLRGFETAEDVAAERQRALMSASPFNAGTHLNGLSMETYAPFPYLPPIKPGAFGGVYEFRAYALKPGGVAGIVTLWESWIAPRVAVSPLLVAMYALDGAPRYVHVWPYADAAVRAKTRAECMSKGVWPPKGSAPWIQSMRSTLTVPLPGSPLA